MSCYRYLTEFLDHFKMKYLKRKQSLYIILSSVKFKSFEYSSLNAVYVMCCSSQNMYLLYIKLWSCWTVHQFHWKGLGYGKWLSVIGHQGNRDGIVDFKRQPWMAIKLCKKKRKKIMICFSLHETFVINCKKKKKKKKLF